MNKKKCLVGVTGHFVLINIKCYLFFLLLRAF